MKIKTISVTYERKFNLGDYNSATCGCTAWADLEENDSVEDGLEILRLTCRESVKAQALPLVKNQPNERTISQFAGKGIG